MRKNRLTFSKLIFFTLILILLKHIFLLPIYKSKWMKNLESKGFRVELKNRNISYIYSGHGKHECGKSNLLIATLSRPNAFSLRMGVRNSWGKFMPPSFTHKFFIGGVRNNETLTMALNEESIQYEDIVFTNLTDSYLNLTLKMNSLFQWQQNFCPKVEFFLRADEDTVLDVVRFKYWLNKEFINISNKLNKMVIFGDVFPNITVVRNPHEKWSVSFEEYKHLKYPDFVHGPSYLLTSNAIKAILEEAKNHMHMPIDDAFYTGIVAERIGITRIDLKKHFANGNPQIQRNAKYECDENSKPFLFSIFDEAGEIESTSEGYINALGNLKNLRCSS